MADASRGKIGKLGSAFLLGFARCFDLFHTLRFQRTLPPPPLLQPDFFEDDAGVNRNDPCPCGAVGSDGKKRKFKKCCGLNLR